MDSDSQITGLILFLVFIVVNFLLYGFRYAVEALNITDLEREVEEGSKKAGKLLAIRNDPEKYTITRRLISYAMAILVGYYLWRPYTGFVYGKLVSLAGQVLRSEVLWLISFLLVLFYLLFLMLALGMLLPGKLGARYAGAWSNALLGVNSVLMTVLTPISALIKILANLILRIFGIDPNESLENVTEEEIKSIVSEGHEAGVIEANEAEMIANIFEWGDKEAQDIMTHRKNITGLNGELTLKECVQTMLAGNYTRYPVYEEDIDDVIGILHLKEAVIALEQKQYGDWRIKDIPELLQKPYFIPETRNIDALFRDMQSGKVHMAVVIDEYGQTSGIISMEDILEEIVGNILDEYDAEEETNIVKTGENTYLLNGMTTLEELAEELDIHIDEDSYDTLNGYLLSELGRIPAEGETPVLISERYQYEILKVENKMISKVALTILPPKEEEEDADKDKKEKK